MFCCFLPINVLAKILNIPSDIIMSVVSLFIRRACMYLIYVILVVIIEEAYFNIITSPI